MVSFVGRERIGRRIHKKEEHCTNEAHPNEGVSSVSTLSAPLVESSFAFQELPETIRNRDNRIDGHLTLTSMVALANARALYLG